jgi:HAD superfamily hydrolase (TIGR01509 family)
MKSTCKAVIFDMDGLLIDTESHSKAAWQGAAQQIGESLDDETMYSLIGRHIGDCLDIVSKHIGKDLCKVEFMEKVDNIYFSNFMRHGIDVKHGAANLLDHLTKHRILRAVATSSEKEIAPRKLRLAGLAHYFEVIVTGCEVAKSKPAPDIFLLAATHLGVDPANCLVLEDSYTGVRGAYAAGMRPIMIPDLLPPTDEMRELTVGIFPNLEAASDHIFDWLGI